MPFVHLRWRPTAFEEAEVIGIRDAIIPAVARLLTEADPAHLVTDAMVDVRVEEIGPLDRIRGNLFVTLLARDEPDRQAARSSILAELAAQLRQSTDDVVVELVLTQHASSFDYSLLEGA
jgi:hypothetical protein